MRRTNSQGRGNTDGTNRFSFTNYSNGQPCRFTGSIQLASSPPGFPPRKVPWKKSKTCFFWVPGKKRGPKKTQLFLGPRNKGSKTPVPGKGKKTTGLASDPKRPGFHPPPSESRATALRAISLRRVSASSAHKRRSACRTAGERAPRNRTRAGEKERWKGILRRLIETPGLLC